MARYISVAELGQQGEVPILMETGLPVVGWNFILPEHVDQERIEVNMSRVRLIHNIGAFSAAIVSSYQGNTSLHLNVAGYEEKDKRRKQKTVDLPAENSVPLMIDPEAYLSKSRSAYACGWPVALIRVNRPEAIRRALDLRGEARDDDRAWAKVLDSTLRETYRKIGKNSLVNRVGLAEKSVNYLLAGAAVYSVAPGNEIGTIAPAVFYSLIYAANLAVDSVVNIRAGLPPLQERRWSLFLANQLDRYAALNAISRVPGLVKVRK